MLNLDIHRGYSTVIAHTTCHPSQPSPNIVTPSFHAFKTFWWNTFMYFSFTSLYPLSTHWAFFLRTFLSFLLFFPPYQGKSYHTVYQRTTEVCGNGNYTMPAPENATALLQISLEFEIFEPGGRCTWVQTSETQRCGGHKIAFREKKRVETKPMVQTSSPLSLGKAER